MQKLAKFAPGKNKSLLFTIIFFLIPLHIIAQSNDLFRDGELFFDIEGGVSKVESPAIDFLKDTSLYQFSAITNANQSPSSGVNQNRQILGFYQLINTPEPEVSVKRGRFGIEYAVTNWLGLGGSLNSTKIKIKDYPHWQTFYPYLYGLANGSTSTSGEIPQHIFSTTGEPSFYDYLLTFDRTNIELEDLNTLDFNIGFHLPGSENFDPYIQLALGGGSIPGGYITKMGIALAVRYAPGGSNLYLSARIFGTSFNIISTGDSASNSVLTETGLLLGVGYRI